MNSFWTTCRLHTRLNSNTTSRIVLTHDWLNSNWITVACYILPFISHDQQSDECTCRRMFLPSRNLYKCKQAVYCVFCLRSSLKNCCCYQSALWYCLFISLSPYFFLCRRCFHIFVCSFIMLTSLIFLFLELLLIILRTYFPFS